MMQDGDESREDWQNENNMQDLLWNRKITNKSMTKKTVSLVTQPGH
jgi:hypothetical protein